MKKFIVLKINTIKILLKNDNTFKHPNIYMQVLIYIFVI